MQNIQHPTRQQRRQCCDFTTLLSSDNQVIALLVHPAPTIYTSVPLHIVHYLLFYNNYYINKRIHDYFRGYTFLEINAFTYTRAQISIKETDSFSIMRKRVTSNNDHKLRTQHLR